MMAERIYPECPTIIRIVKTGGLTKAEFLDAFQQHSISMNAYGERLFSEIQLSELTAVRFVETVQLKVRHLGFGHGATADDVFEKAITLGLELCPLELACHLRLQFLDQPEGRWITIASRKPSTPVDAPNGFYLQRREDGLWLRGYMASADYVFDADEEFIFVHRRD